MRIEHAPPPICLPTSIRRSSEASSTLSIMAEVEGNAIGPQGHPSLAWADTYLSLEISARVLSIRRKGRSSHGSRPGSVDGA